MSEFVNSVRLGKTPQPTQKSFSLNKWEKYFSEIQNPSNDDVAFYETGKWVFDNFDTVRKKLVEFNLDNVSKEIFLQMLVGMTNHVAYLMTYIHFPIDSDDFLFQEQVFKAKLGSINKIDPNATPDMVITSSIDSIRFPLIQALSHKITSSSPIKEKEIINNIAAKILLGQFYNHIDSVWMECLWNNWTLHKTDNIDALVPAKNIFTLVGAVSEFRRQILSSEKIYHLMYSWNQLSIQQRLSFIASVPTITIKGNKKKKRYEIKPSSQDNIHSAKFVESKIFIEQGFYKEFLDLKLPNLFNTTTKDLLRVWEVLYALAIANMNRLPKFSKKTETEQVEKLDYILQFAPIIYLDELTTLLTKWLHISKEKAEKIINFFSYNDKPKSDIWGKPIVKLDNKRVILLLSPIVYGNIERTVELFMKEGGLDFGKSGFLFEAVARKELEISLSNSKILKCSEVYQSNFELKVGTEKEEIDLIIKLGDTILIGEIKCILFPSEPIERYRYFQILKKAREQILRKVKFIEKNQEKFLKQIQFQTEIKNQSIKIYPFILLNQPFGAGFSLDGVPISDLLILNKFFHNKWEQMVLVDGRNKPVPTNIVSFYQSELEAEKEVFKYLDSPPQLRHYWDNITFEKHFLPTLDEKNKVFCLINPTVSLPMPNLNLEKKEEKWQ